MMAVAPVAHSQQLRSVLDHPIDPPSVVFGPSVPGENDALDGKRVDAESIEIKSTEIDSTEINSAEIKTPEVDSVQTRPSPSPSLLAVSGHEKNVPVDAGEKIDALITKMVLQNIPHQFREDKDWGGQQLRWNGVDVRFDGLKIKTHRKKKRVNHGTWKKYEVSLLNPAEQFSIAVKNMRESHDGKMAFDVHVIAQLKIDGRQAKWIKGVQVFNVSVDGKTKVKLVTTIELRTLMDMTKFPPDLVFRPQATAVKISLTDFRIDRISKLGGEVTQQISRLARRSIEDKLTSQEAKTLKKINEQFAGNADKLRLSLHDAMSTKWSAAAAKFMPADVQDALQE